MCIVSKIWDLLDGCGSGRKISVDNRSTFRSRTWVLTSFPSTKMLTQGAAISPQNLVSIFNYLYINGSSKKKKGQKLLLSREIDATWFQSPKITYSNDFLAQFWGRGKNRTRFGPSLVGQQPPALYAHVHTKDLSALNRPYLSHKHKDNSSRYNLWPDRCASHLLAVFTNGSSTRGCFMLFFTTLRYLSINAPDECPTDPTKLPFIIYSSFLRSKGA